MYLLDTSALIGGWQAPSGTVSISAVTLGELQFGALRTANPAVRAQRLRGVAAAERAYPVLDFTPSTAAHYGELAAAVSAAGRRPQSRALDLQIAATAKEHGLTLVTANPGDLVGTAGLLTVLAI